MGEASGCARVSVEPLPVELPEEERLAHVLHGGRIGACECVRGQDGDGRGLHAELGATEEGASMRLRFLSGLATGGLRKALDLAADAVPYGGVKALGEDERQVLLDALEGRGR